MVHSVYGAKDDTQFLNVTADGALPLGLHTTADTAIGILVLVLQSFSVPASDI